MAFIRVSGLNYGLSVSATVLFSFGAPPLRKIAQLQSPRAHQTFSWPYIFVYGVDKSTCVAQWSRALGFQPVEHCESDGSNPYGAGKTILFFSK